MADAAKKVRPQFPVPDEVKSYFSDKGLKPAFSWQDVWGEEHAFAFTVAKAVDLELLTAFASTLQQSIDAGEGLESWKARVLPELARLGWDRPRLVADPTGAGKDKEVNFAAPRRLETIFWSNVRTARAAGQWERIQRTKEGLPFLLYVRTTSAEPREEHLGWVGLILPVDHPFWETHFPPNGWGCKCSVRQLTAREAARLLKEPGYTDIPPEEGFSDFENRRTGEVVKVPFGVDPGWGTNPGLSRARTLVDNLSMRLDQAGEEAGRKAVQEWLASPAPRIVAGLPESVKLPVALAPRLAKPGGSSIVTVDSTLLREKKIAVADLPHVQATLDGGAGGKTIAHDGWLAKIVRLARGVLALVGFHRTDQN